MAAGTEAKKRINITLPGGVYAALTDAVPERERNGFIVRATEVALRRERIRRVVEALRSKPAWTDEDHPELMTVQDADRYVRRLRDASMSRS